MSDPFSEAMDEAEQADDESDESNGDFDAEQYYDALGSGTKDKTIGIAVNEEMHAFFRELREDDEVDVDVAQSIRDHLEKMAHRHPRVFEKAMRKLEIEREY